jgi:hypothetical protein
MTCSIVLTHLSEIIHRSFGEQINYDDDSDPVVRRLKFLAQSPAAGHASLYEHCRYGSAPRSYVLQCFRTIDTISSSARPGPGGLLHQQWLKSIRYDPRTYEILGSTESSETADIVAGSRAATREVLDAQDPSLVTRSNLLPFRPNTSSAQ